jgi:hypothetical protein
MSRRVAFTTPSVILVLAGCESEPTEQRDDVVERARALMEQVVLIGFRI